ncbi:hypothetical protein HUG15_03010 [Salicibibacter cibarius]|uniref:Uncharacterized protein n=1 Tax=Salicibibacter cibarius TaxID=2743000 RepID=A0A7T7CA97_9BACI|nr:hypothetical protein HUG15_03010 [Salicibibacter cibarius]
MKKHNGLHAIVQFIEKKTPSYLKNFRITLPVARSAVPEASYRFLLKTGALISQNYPSK